MSLFDKLKGKNAEVSSAMYRKAAEGNHKPSMLLYGECCEAQESKASKCLAEFAALVAAKKFKFVFCRGVYLTENTSQPTNVGFVRQQRANCAHGRPQKILGKHLAFPTS